ncbi:uncharacterized protein LOC132190802 [Corylus avellana]|uniref:uncharacterized protein LOC132190802 n=1 Tax=Corylus avellana TaxID=13451 RepID=UPI00286CDCE7|nr:uncharacterized protein LOC132190802 [Corylus avellana]
MTIRELMFEVHYSGKINRGFTYTNVGGDINVNDETYDEDKLSFFEIEGIVKKYGYKSGDLVYYLEPGCTFQGGLKLISSNHNVLEMVAAHKGVPVIELYLISFDKPAVNDDEYEDDNDDDDGEYGENSRIDRDDPYWEEVFEPDLFDEDNNLPGPSMAGGNVEEGGVEGNEEGDREGNEVRRVMGRVMRVRLGTRRKRVMRRWMMIIKMQMQGELKMDPGCRYRVYGRKCNDQESFEIRSIQDKHTCTRQHRNSTVKSGWIADKLIDKFRVPPNMPLKAILGEVKDKWGVDVNNCQLYRARRIVREMLQGKVDRPLPDHPACFQRLYFSLAAMKKGFRAGCRHIIGLDGCFLNGTYKGQLLSAISRDGNNNMYPVALAVVDAEIKDSWGLQPAFDVVLPGGDHRFCVRHLYANYRDSGHRGLALKDKLWAAAVAYTEAEFHKEMDELKHISEDAYNYLSNVDPSLWSRAWFNTFPRCDLLVNNLCECFNAYILNARDLPIISMLEFIRKKLMKRYQTKKDGIHTMTGRLCPRVVAKLDEIRQVAGHCYSTYARAGLYEVTHNNKQYVVNLLRKTCGCRQWDMTGIPCAHAVSAIWFFNANPENYVDDW